MSHSLMTLAFLAGLFCIVARFFRLGALADFLSRPILVGFLNGMAFSIMLGRDWKDLWIFRSSRTASFRDWPSSFRSSVSPTSANAWHWFVGLCRDSLCLRSWFHDCRQPSLR